MRAQTLRAVRCQKNAAFHLPHVTRLIVAMGVRNHIGLRSTVSPEPIRTPWRPLVPNGVTFA